MENDNGTTATKTAPTPAPAPHKLSFLQHLYITFAVSFAEAYIAGNTNLTDEQKTAAINFVEAGNAFLGTV